MSSLLLLLAGAPALAAPRVVRGPFLQQTSATGTKVVVKTDVAARAQVVAQAGAQSIVTPTSDGQSHVMTLTGLTPATEYSYVLRLDGADAGRWTFRTPGAPATAEGRRAVIGVIGDMGSGGANARANVARLAQRRVQLLLTVGDNSYPEGAPAEWDPKFFQPAAPLLPYTTLAPALGDHEYLTPGATGYLGAFELPPQPGGERYYSFDWGDLHVVVLDSNCLDPLDPEPVGCTGAGMIQWLEQDLSRTSAPWKVVTLHRPAVASGRYGPSPEVAAALIPVAERHGVDIVFQGHNHFYERTWPMRGGAAVQRDYRSPRGPVYVSSGGGGDWVYDSPPNQPAWSAFRATAFQHLVMTLADGSLVVESIRPDGTVLDTFNIQKDVPPLPAPPPPPPPPADGGEGDGPGGGTPPPSTGEPQPGDPPGGPSGCGGGVAVGGTLPVLAALALVRARRRPSVEHGNRTHQGLLSQPFTGFEDRTGHQARRLYRRGFSRGAAGLSIAPGYSSPRSQRSSSSSPTR